MFTKQNLRFLFILIFFIIGCHPSSSTHSFELSIHLVNSNTDVEYTILVPFPSFRTEESEQIIFDSLEVQGEGSITLVDSVDYEELGFPTDEEPCEFLRSGGLLIEGTGTITISGGEANNPQIDLNGEISIFDLPMYLACTDDSTGFCSQQDHGFYLHSDDGNETIYVEYYITASYYCGFLCAGGVDTSLKGNISEGWNILTLIWDECWIS